MNFTSRFVPCLAGISLCLAIVGSTCRVHAADRPVALGSEILTSPRASAFGVPQAGPLSFSGRLGGSQIIQPGAGPSSIGVLSGKLQPPTPIQGGGSLGTAGPVIATASPADVTLFFAKSGDGIVVDVPRGMFQVTLEQATANGWKPVDTVHLNGSAQSVSFVPPAGVALESLRTVGTADNKFPAGQFLTRDVFDSQSAWLSPTMFQNAVILGPTNSNLVSVSSGTLSANNSLTSASTLTLNAASTSTTAAPEAVESDIWKIIGDRLFFFNQYRGMQVFDLADPAHPVKKGAVRMAAVGEQFYALDDKGSALALLTRNNTRNTALGISTLQVMTVSAEGRPKLVKQLPLDGSVADSRLLGSRIYILLSKWDNDPGSKVSLVGYDLSAPEAPVSLGSLDLPSGYYLALQASGPYLMVSSSLSGGWGWNTTTNPNAVSVIDTSAKGSLRLVKTVHTTGYLADQFKMNIDGDTLTAVSMAWVPVSFGSQRQTWVETFSISSLTNEPVGRLKIDKADGEQLFATRFDSGRLYVVTFRQVDPLFIIDLKDPANPAVRGELITPGYSSFIEPHGNRLLAVGVESWRVCVSWFDVSDVTSPKLLSRVYPGGGGSTWSEATYDHKAVNWVREENRIFLPFQQWNGSYYTSATQVVSLDNDALVLGAVIWHKGAARRGDIINDSLVSISGQQMVVTTNPDSGTPTELARVELSWPVDRVVALDRYLVQAEGGNRYGWWGYSYTSTQEAVLRLSDKDDPDTVLDSVSLGKGFITGLARRGAYVYVGQLVPPDDLQPYGQMRTWTVGVDAAGKLQRLSDASAAIHPDVYWQLDGSAVQAAWVAEDTLVWQVSATIQNYGVGCCCILSPILILNSALFIGNNSITPEVQQPMARLEATSVVQAPSTRLTVSSGELCAMVFPVRMGLAGALKAGAGVEVDLPQGGSLRSLGKPFVDHGFLFFSAERGYFYNYYGWNDGYMHIMSTGNSFSQSLEGIWGSFSSLHVLDFRFGLDPVVRNPVSLSGALLGVSSADRHGAFLLTGGFGYDSIGNSRAQVVSSAYDGAHTCYLDSLQVGSWSASCADQGQLFLALEAQGDPVAAPVVKSLRLRDRTGLIEECGTWKLDQPAYTLKALNHRLLASSWGFLDVAEIKADATLVPNMHLDLPDTVWFNVDRATLDPDLSGLWLPAGDYGVDHFSFGK